MIRQTYATDQVRNDSDKPCDKGVGWELMDEDGTTFPMSQEIETEILIPIYNPSAKVQSGPKEILGIANFEWVAALSKKREAEICKDLVKRVQSDRTFPISLFTCDVLHLVATPDPIT